MNSKNLNPAISIIRVVAMLSVVFGHICTWKHINLYQMGGIGVEIFLFISGYLYGKKEIVHKGQWLAERAKKILIPFWILSLILAVYVAVCGDVIGAFLQIVESLLNLVGLNWIILYPIQIGKHHVAGLSHCWFLTAIMLCYGITALLKGSKLEAHIDRHSGKYLLGAIVLQMVMAYAGIQLCYVIQYFTGYFFRRAENRQQGKMGRIFAVCTVVMIALCGARLVVRGIIDGSVLYDRILARLSFNALGVWLYMVMSGLCKKFSKLTASVAGTKLWQRLDALSYPIFLVHYMFMKAPFAVDRFIAQPIWQVCAVLVLTLVCALVLEQLAKLTNTYMKSQVEK